MKEEQKVGGLSFDNKFIDKDSLKNEVAVIVGTRPGIIMLAPVVHELERQGVPYFIVHTGQHFSPSMDSQLFEDLELPAPQYHFASTSEKRTHGGQTAVMLEECEKAFMERKPKVVLVNGDANTNLAAALAARKLRISIGHIEAGERSFDWSMPEEHNRRIMDHISELLFTTNEKGASQLKKEQVMGDVYVTGNTIADASMNHAAIANKKSRILDEMGLTREGYIIMTSHREENVDAPSKLEAILKGAEKTAAKVGLPVLFMAHPRTQKRIEQFGLQGLAAGLKGVSIFDALRYLDFMQLLINSKAVLTDSGGVQQEAYVHRRPCVTMRENTEWTETLSDSANRLSGATCPDKIADSVVEALQMKDISWKPIFGDGKASARIVNVVARYMAEEA